MKLVITDVIHNGQRGIMVEGSATSAEMLGVINTLIHGHIEALVNVGIPRQAAVASTAREVSKFVVSPSTFAGGSIITSTLRGGGQP